MTEPKTVDAPICAILSIITGRLIPPPEGSAFDALHKLAEFLAGRPVWTHEFASKELADWLAAQCRMSLPNDLAAELAKPSTEILCP